jgi:hypothetical protein
VAYAVFAGGQVATCGQWTDAKPAPPVEDVVEAFRDLRRGFGVPDWEPDGGGRGPVSS